MKIIVRNADFTLANAKFVFKPFETETVISSRYLHYLNGALTADSSYTTYEYAVPSDATAVRLSGTFYNTVGAAFVDSNDTVIDVISTGKIEVSTFENEMRFIPVGTAKIRVCQRIYNPAYDKPILEYTSDSIAGTKFRLGTYKYSQALLTYNTGAFNPSWSGFSVVSANIEGMSKVYVSGSTFKNCCALVFYADKELSTIVQIAYNNNGVLGNYTLENAVADVPEGAKYAATCFPDSSGYLVDAFMEAIK